jgi:uncharacterized protein
MFQPSHRFLHPDVASLAWAIYSTPLMGEVPGMQLCGESWCLEQYELHSAWLVELDEDPTPLLDWMQKEGQKLLGKRFESLIAFWLHSSPHYDLLHRNVLFSSNKNTTGEVDFIVYDKIREVHMHLEVACKYYVQQDKSAQWVQWVGPNGHDSLLQKMDKLKHQVKIFDTVEGRNFLHQEKLPKPSSFVFMKGHLFHHFTQLQGAIPPKHAHAHYNTGWYVRANELQFFESTPSQWLVIPKSYWTCPWQFPIGDFPLLDGQELMAYGKTSFEQSSKALMIVQVMQDEKGNYNELSRGMIVRN